MSDPGTFNPGLIDSAYLFTRQLRLRMVPLARPALIKYRHRGIRAEDATLASYPRSGVTWMKMMLGHALTGASHDFSTISRLIPYVGAHATASPCLSGDGRLIWSHEQRATPSNRIIYLVRDPRSVIPSLHRFALMWGITDVGLEQFVDQVLHEGEPRFGLWGEHVAFWRRIGQADSSRNFLLVRFEDMRQDPALEVTRVLRFLGVSRCEAEVEAAVAGSTLEEMRLKEARSGRRKYRRDLSGIGAGQPEGWRETLPPRCAEAIVDRFRHEMESLGYL